MSEFDVPGISSALTFDLSAWTPNVLKAGEDATRIGSIVESSLADASAAGTASATSLAAGVEHAMAKAVAETREQTSAFGGIVRSGFADAATSATSSTNALALGVEHAMAVAVTETRQQAASVNRSLASIGEVEPVSVVRWGEGLRSVAGIAGTVSPQLGQLVSGFTAVEGAAESAGLSMGTAAIGIGAAVGSLYAAKAAFSFAAEGVSLAADMEQVSISFETMIGNATLAKQTLEGLKAFADTTPFQFPEIASAAKQLLAMGIPARDLVGTLRRLGDVSAGLSQPLGDMAYLLGQVRSQGRAMTQDLNQFAGRGVPIYRELAAVMHTTESGVRELAEGGKIGFAEIEEAIRRMTDAGGQFHDLTKRQAASIRGELSTLADAWDSVKRSMGEAFLDGGAAGDGIETLTTKVNALTPAADRFGAALRHAFESAIPLATKTLDMASFLADKLAGTEGTGTVKGSANPSVTKGLDQTSDPKALLAVASNLSAARKTMAASIRSVDSMWDGVNQGGVFVHTQDVTDGVKANLDKSYEKAGQTGNVNAVDALVAKLTAKQESGQALSKDELEQLRKAIASIGGEVDQFRTTLAATKTDLQGTQREFEKDPLRAKMNTNRIGASELDPHVAITQKGLDDSRAALTAVADALAAGRVAALPKPTPATPARRRRRPAAPA